MREERDVRGHLATDVPGFIVSAARHPRGGVTGPSRVLGWPTSWLTTAPSLARKRDFLVIFPGPGEHHRKVTERVEIGTGEQAVLVLSPGFSSDG